MTKNELNAIETSLKNLGYRKYTVALTSNESWAWFKSFGKVKDEDGHVVAGFQVAFRVWDFTKYGQTDQNAYGLDFWASPLGTSFRMDFSSNWEPICDIAAFESMAAEFYKLVKRFVKE